MSMFWCSLKSEDMPHRYVVLSLFTVIAAFREGKILAGVTGQTYRQEANNLIRIA